MANPQIENGYTKISNELLEAVIKMPMSDYESRVFWLILRRTYGYRKKSDWMSLSQIAEGTNINKSHVCRTLKKLINKNMIVKNGKTTSIQKNFDEWKLPKQVVPKQVINKSEINKKLPKQVIKVTQTGNKTLPKQGYTKERKKRKKYIYAKKVLLTPEEFKKLIEQLGEEQTKNYVTDLSLYKQSKGKNYKSDYATILTWNRKDIKEGKNRGGNKGGKINYAKLLANAKACFKEHDRQCENPGYTVSGSMLEMCKICKDNRGGW